MQAMSRANGHAGRLHPLIQPIFAIIALDDFTRIRIPLGRTPWTGRDAGFASHTGFRIHINNAVFYTATHGAGGAGAYTPRFFAMKTWHKHIRGPRQPIDKFRAHVNNLAYFRSGYESLVGFTLNLTGVATYAFFCILKEVIFTHLFPPEF
jgi:hypothetical protein